jgi:hypothetical protein
MMRNKLDITSNDEVKGKFYAIKEGNATQMCQFSTDAWKLTPQLLQYNIN